MENLISNNAVIIYVVLTIVVFGLGIYLGIMLSKLKIQKAQSLETVQKEKERLAKRDEFIRSSIVSLSRAAVQGQCELSEACIRVKKLLENYPRVEQMDEFGVIQKMYRDLSEFDYLEARSQLTKQERFKQDNKRFRVEDDYREIITESFNSLIKHFTAH